MFVGNLLVASESFRKPLLRVRAAEGAVRAAHPAAAEGAGRQRLRARRGGAGQPLVVWSPAPGESCQVELASLEDLRQLQPGFEPRGPLLRATTWARSSAARELRRYELARLLPGLAAVDDLPADVRRLLGWREGDARTPGAYPFRAEAPAARGARVRDEPARGFARPVLTPLAARDYMRRRFFRDKTD